MKLNKIFLVCFTAAAVFFTSCKTQDPITGITLDEATLSMSVDETATLTATLLPAGSSATITWTSSNTSVVTVADGVVTAVAVGTADVTAAAGGYSAKCTVTVSAAAGDFSASLNGSNYFLIILDATSAAKIASTKIVADFRPDDVSKFLYIWDATYSAGTPTGPNFYGEVEGWTSFIVNSVGWSGGGFFCSDLTLLDKMADITNNPNDYYLHIGMKGKDQTSHLIGLDGAGSAKFCVGPTAFTDNGTTYQPIANYTRDGEWNEIEIPISTLKNLGLLYSTGNTGGKNVFWFLSGATTGVTLELDAVFIYKKS